MLKRGENGRFQNSKKDNPGTYVDDRGYLRISSGPLRGVRVHKLVALAKFGEAALAKDAAIHHIDGDKQNPHPDNLELHTIRDHNAISAKQAWMFKQLDIKQKKAWNEFFLGEKKKENNEDERADFNFGANTTGA